MFRVISGAGYTISSHRTKAKAVSVCKANGNADRVTQDVAKLKCGEISRVVYRKP